MRKLSRAILLVLVGLTAGCTAMDDALVAVFGRSMRKQDNFRPYEDMRLPAEGSVSFSSANYPSAFGDRQLDGPNTTDYLVPDFNQGLQGTANPEAAVWSTFDNPLAGDASTLARGQQLYERVCAVCHGDDGIGSNALVYDRWPVLVAYNLAGPVVAGYSDSYIYGMIRAGRGQMPAYGYAISHFDRWAVVNYIRTLQQQAGNAGDGEDR